MDPFLHILFVLTTDEPVDPGVISDRLGLQPTKTWRKGEHRVVRDGSVVGVPYATSGWTLELEEQSVRLPELLEQLLDRMEAVSEELAAIRDDLSLTFHITVAIHMADQAPDGCLDVRILRRITDLDADLDFDLYVEESDWLPVRHRLT